MSKDPVCGMEVKPENAAAKSERSGTTYLFCSVACKQQFEKDPARFVGEKAKSAQQQA